MSPPFPAARCPVCAKSMAPEYAPFCSRGCRDRDLVAWLSEDYRLPAGGLDSGLDTEGEPD